MINSFKVANTKEQCFTTDKLQQSRLACTIATEQANIFSAFDL